MEKRCLFAHRLSTLRRRLAVVFQEPLLFDTTVAENVASGLKLRGVATRCNPEQSQSMA